MSSVIRRPLVAGAGPPQGGIPENGPRPGRPDVGGRAVLVHLHHKLTRRLAVPGRRVFLMPREGRPVIELGMDFARALVEEVGEDPDLVKLDTVTIRFVNPDGPTTVTYQKQAPVPAERLVALVDEYRPKLPEVVQDVDVLPNEPAPFTP